MKDLMMIVTSYWSNKVWESAADNGGNGLWVIYYFRDKEKERQKKWQDGTKLYFIFFSNLFLHL